MLTTMIIVFLIGYLLIALEHPLKINKAGNSTPDWNNPLGFIYIGAPQFIPTASAEEFKLFLDAFPFIKDLPMQTSVSVSSSTIRYWIVSVRSQRL